MIELIKAISLYLGTGTLGMIGLGIMRAKKYGVSYFKAILSMLFLTIFGVLGVLILFYIENGYWGGQSYFGAVLITPLLLFPIAKVLRIEYLKFLGYCAPAECLMLAVMKLFCLKSYCCFGTPLVPLFKIIPLQVIESIVALILVVVLISLEKNKDDLPNIYGWYLVLYGVGRFILNFFRAELNEFMLGMSAGHFWALVSLSFGFVFLYHRGAIKKNSDSKNM